MSNFEMLAQNMKKMSSTLKVKESEEERRAAADEFSQDSWNIAMHFNAQIYVDILDCQAGGGGRRV